MYVPTVIDKLNKTIKTIFLESKSPTLSKLITYGFLMISELVEVD